MSKVVDNGDFHKLLENRRPVELQVIDGIPCSCKVDLRGMQPPLVVQVRYRTPGDLHAYGSYKNQEPDAHSFDSSHEKPHKIVITDPKSFKSSQYYLSFNSQSGVSIGVTAYFTSGPNAGKGDGPIKFERRMTRKEARSDIN